MTSRVFSLAGLRILHTRPLKQGKDLNEAIRLAGGIPIHLPTIAISPTALEWTKHFRSTQRISLAIFTSANAVHYFFQGLKDKNLLWPATIQTIAIGEKTAGVLKTYQGQWPLYAEQGDSEHLLGLKILSSIEQLGILLIKGEGGRPLIEETLRQRGASLTSLAVYKRSLPVYEAAFLKAFAAEKPPDIIIATSQEALQNLFTLLEPIASQWLKETPCLVFSERIAHLAKEIGIKKVLISRYDRIIETLSSLRKNNDQ